MGNRAYRAKWEEEYNEREVMGKFPGLRSFVGDKRYELSKE